MSETKDIKRISLDEAAGLSYLSPDKAVFEKKGEFPALTLKDDDGETVYDRVWLHLVFPYDLTDEFISVQNKEQEEIGIIRSLSDFDDETVSMLKAELERKYFVPKIMRIITLRERHGFSYWKVETDIGEMELSFQDTYKSITRVGSDRAFVTDISGNRYEIVSLDGLDRRSRKKLELYL